MNYPSDYVNKIICGDCLDVMKYIPDKSIDLIITSPPYDNLRDYKGYKFDFIRLVNRIQQTLKVGGVLVWVVGDATIKGSETGTSFRQALGFMAGGLNLHDTMIYRKINYIPQTHNRYEQEFEYMFVFSNGKLKIFNPLMRDNKCAGKTYNPKRPRDYDNHSMRHYRDETLVYKDQSIRGNIFEYVVGSGNERTNHPATFPKKLAEDHILSWSNENDIVLDPMCGSGTTCKMAKKNNRNYIGIDISEEYCEIARQRLLEVDR